MRTGRTLIAGVVALGGAILGDVSAAQADPPAASQPTHDANVMVILATKCTDKKVDQRITEPVPPMGYDCLELLDTRQMPLTLNQPSTTVLPNKRTFQLLPSDLTSTRYKVAASISSPDGSGAFLPVATIGVGPNTPINVGGFAYQGGALVLTIKIVPRAK